MVVVVTSTLTLVTVGQRKIQTRMPFIPACLMEVKQPVILITSRRVLVVRNMNFLRLKTLQISYNLPKPWVNKVHLKNAAVYVMGTNLFTLSRFKLWDPELNTDNGASYPNTTSYSVGINFTF